MKSNYNISEEFELGLNHLGFRNELGENLFFIKDYISYKHKPALWFQLEKAKILGATAVYFRKILGEIIVPQLYLYDYSDYDKNDVNLTNIHKDIWTSGVVPLVCVFFKTEIKILDCTQPIIVNQDNESPKFLVESLSLIGKVNKIFNEQFANSIKSGLFWDTHENRKNFKYKNSSYDKLVEHLRKVIKDFVEKSSISPLIAKKLIIQSILIKYLEERISIDNNNQHSKVFPEDFFQMYSGAKSFCDVLRNGKCLKLFDDLNKEDYHEGHFNGKIFEWNLQNEREQISKIDLSLLADALDGNSDVKGQYNFFWRQYSFNYIPVEFISRLYEEFLVKDEKNSNNKKEGIIYTPAHLAKLLVDESMPLDKPQDAESFKILDPACGSGIFLVIAYKRLVQWWRIENNMQNPSLDKLKEILRNNIFGIDKEPQGLAVKLTCFSLSIALCDELTPKQIWNNLKFDDLSKYNIIKDDFFIWKNNNTLKFDLIIGNPPFKTGGISKMVGYWRINDEKIKIPQNQIALKFLCESIDIINPNGLICLIIKASSLLYNSSSTSIKYKKALFENYDIKQVLDFTPLARNNTLWDNADVATAAIFLKNKKPNYQKNILHAIFRRTKAIKDRIAFEIDNYDLHYVDRLTAIKNQFIWKINLLGGGRIKNLIDKVLILQNLQSFCDLNNCLIEEGIEVGIDGKHSPEYLYDRLFLPTKSVNEERIDFSKLKPFNRSIKVNKIPGRIAFECPNIIIKENIGNKSIPIFLNLKKDFTFNRKIISISSKDKNLNILEQIYNSLQFSKDFNRFFLISTSAQILVNLNSVFMKGDLLPLPLILESGFNNFSNVDLNIINDVNNFMEDFLRHGESSGILKAIKKIDNNPIINFGNEFSNVLNIVYEDKGKKFRLSDIIRFNDNKFIGTIFTYDDKIKNPVDWNMDYNDSDFNNLFEFNFSNNLNFNRIIKYYTKDKVIFIKPNQYRYWLPLIAYRDADRIAADLSRKGF